MRLIRKAILVVIVALVCAQAVYAVANPLSVQVSCTGCSDKDFMPGGYEFRADENEKITFAVSSSGGIGSKSYSWVRNGNIVCDRASFQLIVTENVEYILTVTDDGGSVSEIVKIIPIFPQELKCLPGFRREITVHDRVRDRTEYSVGDVFTVKVRLDTNDCLNSNYQFYWTADDENIIFANPNSTETEVRIGQGISNGRVEIKAVIINSFTQAVRSRDTEIKIVSNTPPSEVRIRYDESVSYTDFKVYCVDFKTGEHRNEHDDFVCECSVILRNEIGRIIDSASKTVTRDREIPYLKVKPEGMGVYFIEYVVKDSHGLTSTVNETIEVIKGSTGKDIPIVRAPNTIYCVVNEVCEIDASETRNKDEYVSNFGFYLVDDKGKVKERLANSEGDYCSGPICRYNFTYPGTYRIKITANYFDEDNDEDDIGFKIVMVIVSSGDVSVMSTPVLVLTPAATSAPTSAPTIQIEAGAREEQEGIKEYLESLFKAIKNVLNF